MKINDELLKYLTGDLDLYEKKTIEEKISSDPVLQSELESYRKKLSEIKDLGNIEPDTAYFNNILPDVRSKIEKRRKHKVKWQIAYALPVVIILGFIAYNIFSNKPADTRSEISEIVKQMNDSLKAEFLTGIDDQYISSDTLVNQKSNQVLSEELSKEILKNNKSLTAEEYLPIDVNDLVNDMSNEEAERIYKDIINKKIM